MVIENDRNHRELRVKVIYIYFLSVIKSFLPTRITFKIINFTWIWDNSLFFSIDFSFKFTENKYYSLLYIPVCACSPNQNGAKVNYGSNHILHFGMSLDLSKCKTKLPVTSPTSIPDVNQLSFGKSLVLSICKSQLPLTSPLT